ncbi:MAG: YHS domain-containing protein [Calditrichaeota bacterium]|nr:MAG: YHS domain-containing protein [Calditrichota bacterium]MBL1207231.1 YHS domain-containing protein [Calditrichota bacterium]NOG47064.1 YHS domain-containing protein [Calditrichota bacterium]
MKNNFIQTDPVCHKRINRLNAHIVIIYKGKEYFLCTPGCKEKFESYPEKYMIKPLTKNNASSSQRILTLDLR